MSEQATIMIGKREKVNSRASKQLRKTGQVPATISRKGMDSVNVTVKRDDLVKSISKHGRNYLFHLELEGQKPYTVLVKEMHYSPIKRELLHVDFQQVSLKEEIKVNLDIKIIGKEAIDFKKLLLMQQMDKIPVKGLPQDIPDCIEIDVTELDAEDKIIVSDIKFPEGIEPEIEADKIVITIGKSKMKATDTEETEADELESTIE